MWQRFIAQEENLLPSTLCTWHIYSYYLKKIQVANLVFVLVQCMFGKHGSACGWTCGLGGLLFGYPANWDLGLAQIKGSGEEMHWKKERSRHRRGTRYDCCDWRLYHDW